MEEDKFEVSVKIDDIEVEVCMPQEKLLELSSSSSKSNLEVALETALLTLRASLSSSPLAEDTDDTGEEE